MVTLIADGSFRVGSNSPHSGMSMPLGAVHPISVGSPSAMAEAAIGRYKQVIGDGLRPRTDERRATEVNVAIHALNRMSELGRPSYNRIT